MATTYTLDDPVPEDEDTPGTWVVLIHDEQPPLNSDGIG